MPEPMNRREEIARIVDKDAWSISPRTGEMYDMDRMRRERALAKADAIIALPPEGDGVIGELREALEIAADAIAEYQRYFHGGEMRGSYDGKPERAGLWKAGAKARETLAIHRLRAKEDQALSARQTSDTP